MPKSLTAIATALALLVLSVPGHAAPSQSTPAAPTTPATTATVPAAAPAATPNDAQITDMSPITVSVPKPYIWTFQKGNSKVLVLGMVYPEPRGLTFVPVSIDRAIAQSGAIIGAPWFHFSANVNLFNILPIWHAASGAVYLPDGKHLADVLPPDDLRQWRALKAQYLPYNSKVERMRPMYAAWKLYEAVIKHSGVAVDSSTMDLIAHDAKKLGVPMIDAQFHWTVKDPKTAARAFEPSPQADLACFQSILHGISGMPEASRTLAAAWAVGDVPTMQTYLQTHTLTHPCWARVTDDAVAQQQGVDRLQGERAAWLAALHSATEKHPVVFTTASVETIVKPAWQVQWLLDDGYVMLPHDAQPAAATAAPAAPAPKI